MPNTKEFWIVLAAGALVHARLPVRYRAWFVALLSFAYVSVVSWSAAPPGTGLLVKLAPCVFLGLAGAAYYVGQDWRPRPRGAVAALVVAALGYLAYAKYGPTIIALRRPNLPGLPPLTPGQLAIPLGISYFTFKLVHYLVESTRSHHEARVARPNVARHGLGELLSYAFFFPIFPGGPIERFDAHGPPGPGGTVGWLRARADKITGEHVVLGLTRIVYGVSKKFVIVDLILARPNLSFEKATLLDAIPVWCPPMRLEQLLQDLHTLSPAFAWQFLVNQFLTTYVEFSALSDIAIGAALLFGIRVMENFEWPILAKNIGDFWKRWHISLSSWCQQYVYLPMIGRTRSPYVAVFATQIAIGLWHTASLNYLAWGAYHATLMSVFLTWGRVKRAKRWSFAGAPATAAATALTFLCVTAGHAFVSTSALGMRPALRLLVKLFGFDIWVPGAP